MPLNPNHTHHLLVDNGTKNRSGGADIRLRGKIEKAIQDGRCIIAVKRVILINFDNQKHLDCRLNSANESK